MRVASIECLAADGGWRTFDFVKLTLSNGLVGWSEFSRAFGGPGVHAALAQLAPTLLGLDARSIDVRSAVRQFGARSTATQQAAGAIANALLDVHARALGVPVYELLGGAVRDRVRLYWAHCGTYRVSHAELMQRPRVATHADLTALGREVVARGYSALKTNLLLFDAQGARRYAPQREANLASLGAPLRLTDALDEQLVALRAGAGREVEIMLDLGSNFRAAGARTMLEAAAPHGVTWVELEGLSAATLRHLRARTRLPIASGETLRAREFPTLLGDAAVDVAIVDVLFNGLAESLHVAAMAEAYDTNIAVHNCYSPLATVMNAHFAMVAPNLQIMEHDVDAVPWATELVTTAAHIEDGHVWLPAGPGWGSEVNEAAVRAHPAPAL